MMMKKLFALLIALATILSLAACSGDSGNSGDAAEGSAPPANSGGSSTPADSDSGSETSDWPQSAVTLTVSAGAGGGTDICARILLERLSDFGNFVVQNDTDGGGAVGWERVKAGDPETCSEVIFYNTGLYVSYVTGLTDIHPTEELVPVVCLPTGASQYICVPKDSPFDTIQDLVDYAKEHPGELQCGVELGSLSHVYVGLCAKSLGIDWTYVSTGSDNDRITLLMGNNIDVTTINQATAQNYYESGDIKVLAAEQGRSNILGEKMAAVPTLEEAGFDKVDVNTELIVWAPAGASDATYAAIWDGNVCFSAHNRGVNDHFRKIHTLVAGDPLSLTTRLGTRTYTVTGVEKVRVNDSSGTAATTDNRVTLYTCVANQPEYRWKVTAVEG